MRFSKTNILQLIKEGESSKVEFKSKVPEGNILARNLAAFANTNGGYLIIGVSDKGEINGLTESEIEEGINIANEITNSLFDYNIPTTILSIDGKKIIIIYIEKNSNESLPILTSKGELYIREGASLKIAENTARKSAITSILTRNFSHNINSHIINHSKKDEFKVFVAMSFREEEEPALVDYFKAMERSIKITKLPINVSRMDLLEGDYEISQQIMDEIDKSDIVIADFTLSSQNVYFELGYARAKNKRIIQTARKDTKLEFDTRNWRTIFYRNATELETQLTPAIEVAFEQLNKNVSS